MTQHQAQPHDMDTAHHEAPTPQRGDVYRCEQCGMELQCTADCHCKDPAMVTLECCGQEMSRA